MQLKIQLISLMLLAALGWGRTADNWQVIRQEKTQTMLSSPNGVIFIESDKQAALTASPEMELLKIGQAIYPDGQLIPADSLQNLAPNLFGQNFRVLRSCYLPPLEEKMRVIYYAEKSLSVRFFGTTRTQNFDYLETNLDFLAREFQLKQQVGTKQISESVDEPDF